MRSSIVLAAALLGAAHGAHAQFRCDCTNIVDTCTAEVMIRGASIDVTTDRRECARVDYFVDGQPFVSLAVDGEARESWLARTANPRIMVQSCQVCRENEAGAATASPAAPPARSPADPAAELEPLIEVAPAYPPAALAQRLEGHVDVQFTVSDQGVVENARVTAAEPAGVFDQAALAAVLRSRYPSEPDREPRTLDKRVEFRLPAAAEPPAPRATGAAARTTGPRNQCVRQDAVYHYGDMIEVGLLNACEQPLLIYSCATGTGRQAGRWACVDSEQRAALLAPPGGAVVPQSQQSGNGAAGGYDRVENFTVTRAPNTEYWWVACLETDADCRSGARQWTQAVTGQPATLDPQNRTTLPLARSY